MAENKEIKKYPAAIFIHSLSHHLVLALLCRSLEIDRERKKAKKGTKIAIEWSPRKSSVSNISGSNGPLQQRVVNE